MSEVFDDGERRLVAGRSRTLLERLDDPDALVPDGRDESATREVFESWEARYRSEEAFERRLDRAGATRADCMRAIGAGRLAEDEPLPDWMDRLETVVAAVQSHGPDEFPVAADADGTDPDELPADLRFGELTAAIARHARKRLPADPVDDALSEAAVESMARWLRARFVTRFTRILYVEFKTFVAAHDRDLAFAEPESFDEYPTEYYDRFLSYLFDGGFADLCVEYPVFARLLVTQLRQWHEMLVEFCHRLRADRKRLAERFGSGEPVGPVAELQPLAEDTHGDGRAVMCVTFESGLTVAYKPRSVETGATFYEVLDRLNDHLPVPAFETPTYLSRDGYGWMEWVEFEPCPVRAAVERYYRRAGALACITYLLEFSDCQYENLLVAGEHPVLVDGETVMHPHVGPEKQPVQTGTGRLIEDSVLLTGLVPFGLDDLYADSAWTEMIETISGFSVSSAEVEIESVTNPVVRAVNTDVMTVEHEPARVERDENVPSLDGADQPPHEYLDDLVSGFEATYETVLRLRDDGTLAEEVGILDAFEGCENRIVYRQSVGYASLIRALSSRACLSDGARFGVEMDELAVPFCDGRIVGDWPWPLYDAERRALRRLDPPRITSRTDGVDLYLHGEAIGVAADAPGMAESRARIEAADGDGLREQVELLRGCFGEAPAPNELWTAASTPARERVDDGTLRREATALFDAVESAAIEADDGSYHWASVAPWPETDRLTVRPVDGSLYVGQCGIALLGAALYRVTGEDRYRAFALDTVEPIREAVRSGLAAPSLANLGGAVGIGSVAYGLGLAGELLDEPDLLSDGERAAASLGPELVAADDIRDVVGGSAGTILGLLGLHDRTGDPGLLSSAVECGDHLLDARRAVDGVPVWDTINGDGPPLTGFAHGVSGIAYALVRLSDATGDPAYGEAALEALEYESRAYEPSVGNWRDRREWTEPFFDQWCYGRSGVGLARLGMAEFAADDRVECGIERAIEGAPGDELDAHDHVCCGNAGVAAFLLAAERRRGRRVGEARDLLGGALARKRAVGSYHTLSETREVTNPTFFHGVSGIAYSMLRVTDPDALPCVLLWE